MSMSFLRPDGAANIQPGNATVWLPSQRQIKDALAFQIADAVGPEIQEDQPHVPGLQTTMQQGLGLVTVVGLVSGLLPFLVNLVRAGRAGTSLEMLSLANVATGQNRLWRMLDLDPAVMGNLFQQIAGMEPRLPGAMAGFFSALGAWINTPLMFLTLWIAYGAGVLAVSHLAGAKTSLQRFFAATSYAFLPLTLNVLTPLPWLGGLIGLIAWIAFFLLYVRAVATVTSLETSKAVIATLLPGAIFGSLLLIAVSMVAGAFVLG